MAPPTRPPYRRRSPRSRSFPAVPLNASVSVKAGSFVKSTAAAPAVQVVNGLGFVPKALLLWTAGADVNGTMQSQATGNARAFVGIAAGSGPSEQAACATTALPAGTSGRRATQKAVLFTGVGAAAAEASLVGFDYDTFTLLWTTNNVAQQLIHYLAIGGTDVLAKVQSFGAPLAAGNFSVTGVGFQPNVLLQVGTITVPLAYDNTVPSVAMRFGVATGPSSRWCAAMNTPFGVGLPAWRIHRNDRFLYAPNPTGAPGAEFDLVSIDADGYTLSNVTGAFQALFAVLALQVPRVAIGTFSKPAGAGSLRTVGGLGFSPAAVVLVSDEDINRSNTASQTGARFGISAFTPAGDAEAAVLSVANAPGAVSYGFMDQSGGGVVAIKVDNDTPTVDAKASATIGTDGFATSWAPNDSALTEYGYLAFGPAPAAPVHAAVEIEAQLTPGTWVSFGTDLMRPITASYGINDGGPLDLVASSGQLAFVLNNSESNSAGRLGYYSPESTNVRPGFRLGLPVRLRLQQGGVVYYKFHGWLDAIDPMAGKHGERMTVCSASDWMDQAANTKPTAVATQVGARADQVVAAVVAAVPRQPLGGTSYQVADSTFPYALDNSESEAQPVLTELQRNTQSEFGRCYVTGDGVLHWDKRTSRLTPMVVASYDDTMVQLAAPHRRDRLFNKVKATQHPRRVDALNTTVLFSNQGAQLVAAGATSTIIGRYNDPNNRAVRVGGKDFNAPVASTDYLANTAADGTGADLTASFSVVATYGANSVEYTITNTGGVAGYITKLQARGRGLYDYDPVDMVRSVQSSIDAYGESLLALDMPYQADATVGQAVADYIVGTWSVPAANDLTLALVAKNDADKAALLAIEPCVAISLRESVTGIQSAFWVHRVTLTLDSSRYMLAELVLQRAQIASYWTLGTAGLSELGVSTVLAPL